MTDRERFEIILEELGALLSPLGWSCDVVLIGAQALAVEQVAAGEDSVLQVETDTGQRLVRGYSLDLDLLLDPADPGSLPAGTRSRRSFGRAGSIAVAGISSGRSRWVTSTCGWISSGPRARQSRRRR